ncbi:helix-turn-helix domain-containing protein [Paenibacillus periandrae]|uniref:helix-turn-helix domain-containing protein n=1 Tax=Paenibacillus periandrae TaxID=1761741 RepID=UPI001F0A02C8|nr:helix-turn-helix transcriptional regulator [Paenibacillus periandrae]
MIVDNPAEKLKLLRLRKGWTQDDLIDQVKSVNRTVRLYQVMISRYETNKEQPTPEIKQAIHNAIGEKIWD